MIVSTIRFGDIDIQDNKVITMPKPILGFEHLKRYCIIEREDCRPFLWYQAVDDAAVAFIIVNPLFFYPEYRIEVNPRELEELRIRNVELVETYVIVSVPSDPRRMSINLQGPVVISTESRLAKQLILVNSEYRVKHYIMEETDTTVDEIPEDETVISEVAV